MYSYNRAARREWLRPPHLFKKHMRRDAFSETPQNFVYFHPFAFTNPGIEIRRHPSVMDARATRRLVSGGARPLRAVYPH